MRILLSFLWLLILTCSTVSAANNLTADAYLHTQGKDLIDHSGKKVHLHGVNIGGWLVTEGWMCGQRDDRGRGALEQLEARFGTEKAAVLINAWYDHWITTADLDLIASWGMNVIRVPFGWRNLQDADGSWKRNTAGKIDFTRLDWILSQANQRGMYVIFDLHMWPRQMEKDGYGLPSRWSSEGKVVRAKMIPIWTEVARHYKGNGGVAGLDVINEPEGSPWNAPQHAFSDAIRAQDPNRVVIVEWSGYENTPKEFPKNTVYSDHYTFNDRSSFEKYLKSLNDRPDVNVPLFLGEMKAGKDNVESAKWMRQAMDQQGWNWCIWTYKAVDQGGWAAFDYDRLVEYDLAKDSYETILESWSENLTRWQNTTGPKHHWVNAWWVKGFGN